jgi:hypothetical protein
MAAVIVPDDEWPHPFSPDHVWWNESWFWDWFALDGSAAGHLRVGLFPNQDRAWVWLFVLHGGEWHTVEATHLPLAAFGRAGDELRVEADPIQVTWTVATPLEDGRLTASTPSGLAVDVRVLADGLPHSSGGGRIEGHSAEGYETNRFEQPTIVEGTMRVGGEDVAIVDGRGERDHSWGPRDWNMEWTFVVSGLADGRRLMWAVVELPAFGRIATGYLQADGAPVATVTTVDADLGDPERFSFVAAADDGSRVAGTVEALTGAPIDLRHCYDPPRDTTYRRALVRLSPDDGSPPSLGWLEYNRL